MFGKFLLIAFVCASVAQVHGDQLDNVINRGLLRARGMHERVKERLTEAREDVENKEKLIYYKTAQFVEKANTVQENSRKSLRNVAYAMERKAEENNRPESVFQCIRRNEMRANREIETFTTKFAIDMQRLKMTKVENIDNAGGAYIGVSEDLEARYIRTLGDMVKCQNTRCVYTVLSNFSSYVNSLYGLIRRVEGQIGTILGNFQRDANNYFGNSNRQISRIRSAAIRNIRNCYFRGERIFEVSEDSQDSQDTQEIQESQES